jgi:IPT/TIG domain
MVVRCTARGAWSLTCLLVAALAIELLTPLGMRAAHAAGNDSDSSSYGIGATVMVAALPVTLGRQPAAAYPAGPPTATRASLGVNPVASTGVLSAAASGDQILDTSAASAGVDGLDLLGSFLTADTIGSSCASGGALTGTATLANAKAGGTARLGAAIDLPVKPAPNYTVAIKNVRNENVATIVLNEQTASTANGIRSISVNAVHVVLLGGALGSVARGNVVIGHSQCESMIPSTRAPASRTPTGPVSAGISPDHGSPAGGTIAGIAPNPGGTGGGTEVAINGTDVTGTSALTQHSAGMVAGMTPVRGPTAGGTLVTITGVGFTGASRVDFGRDDPGTEMSVVSDTEIHVLTPVHVGEVVHVRVVTPDGTRLVSHGDTFTFIGAGPDGTPAVDDLEPSWGPIAGGTRLTVHGENFDTSTTVTFDGVPGADIHLGADAAAALIRPLATASDTYDVLSVVAPAHRAGPATVVVTTAAGVYTYQDETFTFVPPPTAVAFRIAVPADMTTSIVPGGNIPGGLTVLACGTPVNGRARVAPNRRSCGYTPSGNPGADEFTLRVANVLNQESTQTVRITIVAADSAGGIGIGIGINGDTGDSGTGSLPDTGVRYLLTMMVLGVSLVLTGTGLLAGGSRRKRHAMAGR